MRDLERVTTHLLPLGELSSNKKLQEVNHDCQTNGASYLSGVVGSGCGGLRRNRNPRASYTYTGAHRYAHSDSNADTHSDIHSRSDANAPADIHSHNDAHTHSDIYSDIHSDIHSDNNANSQAARCTFDL